MIKQLRKKIAVINVLLASIIFLSALIVIFTVSYKRMSQSAFDKMNTAIEYAKTESPFEYLKREDYRDIIVMRINLQQNEVSLYASNLDADKQRYLLNLIDPILSSKRDYGLLPYHYCRYVKMPDKTDAGVMYIATMNNMTTFSDISAFVTVSIIITIVGLGCFFLISILLADISLKPVEQSWTQQKQFVADASHELKTPLSVIMANTEIIASNPNETVQSQMRWLENTRSESKRMSQLIANLLFLAKNDDGLKIQLDAINISQIISSMCLTYDALFYENSKTFNCSIDPNAEILGNEQQFSQLISILLDNANKYSFDNGAIDLTLIANNRTVTLTVSNDSNTLSDEQLKHIFDRFYTVDQSRNNNVSGNGLGLSIAKLIVETHNGKISVESSNNKTAFCATLPLLRKKTPDTKYNSTD